MNLYTQVAAAIRSLRRSSAFSCFVVLVFAAGISANALVFAVADAVVFRPFPVPDPDGLVVAGENLIEPRSEITYRDFVAWRQQSQTFSDIALFGSSDWSWRLRTSGDSVTVHYRAVSGNFFSVLGTSAKLGRTLQPGDDKPESRRTVVLGHGFWQRQFGGDPNIIGRTLVLSDVPYTVVGVMPENLLFPSRADVWTPVVPELAAIAASIRDLPPDGGDVGVFYVLGRLKAGVSIDAARLDLDRVIALQPRYESERRVESRVRPFVDEILGSSRVGVLTLFAAVIVLLLVACANVAGLLVTRASSRAHELAVRVALGASAATLVRQVICEVLVLSAGATILALPVAAALLPVLVAILPPEVPRIADAALNVRVFGFAALGGMITAAVSSVIPAVRVAHRDVDSILRRTSQSMLQPGLRHPVRRALIGGELAAAVLLVTAAGLLARSVWQLRHLDIGFDANGVIAIEMGMPMEHMADGDRRLLLQQALDRILLVPGVRSASGVSLGPLNGPVGLDSPYELEGQAKQAAARNPYVNTETITPAYFDTMRTRLLAGRTFDRFDREGSAPVVIVSRQFAERAWPGQDPLGKRLHVVALDRTATQKRTIWTVVGVVGDIRYRSLDSPGLTVYAPAAQSPDRANEFVVRADVLDATLLARLRQTIGAVNGNSTVRMEVMDDVLAALERPWRANLVLFGTFAFATAAIACLGLYSMVTYAVVSHQREIGIRRALGASSRRIMGEVLSAAGPTIAGGLVGGFALAAMLTPLLRAVLFDVRPSDPLVFLLSLLMFAAVALLASTVPAFRATRIDPAVCLKTE
jgi:predicted permease